MKTIVLKHTNTCPRNVKNNERRNLLHLSATRDTDNLLYSLWQKVLKSEGVKLDCSMQYEIIAPANFEKVKWRP